SAGEKGMLPRARQSLVSELTFAIGVRGGGGGEAERGTALAAAVSTGVGEPGTRRARIWAIVVAAGSSSRFGRLKQFESLAGRQVLDWSMEAARSVAAGVVLVVRGPARAEDRGADVVVAGGSTRAASVRAGLDA